MPGLLDAGSENSTGGVGLSHRTPGVLPVTQDPRAVAYPLRVNDLKQWAYCPRIVFYNTVMPVARRATTKMERGAEVELRLDILETRRTLRRYGLSRGDRRANVWLSSERLGLSGRLDMLITTPEGCFPVDFKYTRDRPRRNHVLQVGAYALLVEDAMRQPVPAAFIYLVPRNLVVQVRNTDGLRQHVMECLAAIRAMVSVAVLPEPTPIRARCEECEFRNYCGDVF
jgi:CRISPR-associated exonuclease Cas4